MSCTLVQQRSNPEQNLAVQQHGLILWALWPIFVFWTKTKTLAIIKYSHRENTVKTAFVAFWQQRVAKYFPLG